MNTEIYTTIVASIAACFSALASWLIWSQQKRVALDSIRPDLILDGWTFVDKNNMVGEIQVNSLRNVGRGPALSIRAFLNIRQGWHIHEPDAPFSAYMIQEPLHILPSGEKIGIDSKGMFSWKYRAGDLWVIGLDLKLLYWDIQSNRYETIYYLIAIKDNTSMGGAQLLAPGLYLASRSTRIKGRKRLVVESQINALVGRIKKLIWPKNLVAKNKSVEPT